MWYNVWFYVWYGLAAFCAIIFAFKSYRKKGRLGVFAGNMFLAAGMLNIAYLVRIIVKTYFMASLFAVFISYVWI